MESRIEQAFKAVPRVEFLPDELKHLADIDAPIAIGYGQTNSQPYTVATMLKLLDPKDGEHILDVGSGSGWTSGLLSYLVGDSGKVVAVELVEELVDFGSKNCQKLGINTPKFHQAKDNVLGWPEDAPYDRILVSAAASNSVPESLLKQLEPGGRLVIPIDNDIWVVDKDSKEELSITKHHGFGFVPLIN